MNEMSVVNKLTTKRTLSIIKRCLTSSLIVRGGDEFSLLVVSFIFAAFGAEALA